MARGPGVLLRKAAGLLVAALMFGVGAAWAARGLGWIGEPPTGKDALWYATVGPLLLGFGVALGFVVVRGTATRDRP